MHTMYLSFSTVLLCFMFSSSAVSDSYIDHQAETDICQLPAKASSFECVSSTVTWAFDPRTGYCRQLYKSGCWVGKHVFESESECLARCVKGRDIVKIKPAHYRLKRATDSNCLLPPEKGYCRGYFQRYFYNSATKKCESFVYSGCGSNTNHFLTSNDCYQTCQGV